MKKNTVKITLSAMFIALGYVLPFLTGSNQVLGSALCLMHLPVLICGFVCGWQYGMCVGFIVPLLRSFTVGKPTLYPTALAMAFELAAYGFFAGMLYKLFKEKAKLPHAVNVYTSLIASMLLGRAVWGIASYLLYMFGNSGKSFTYQMFIAGAFANATAGIAIQIIVVPLIVIALKKAGLIDNE